MSRSNIAAAINAAHERVEAARKSGVEAAVDCGKLLTEAKATVKHGGWEKWVATNCRFSARTAQLYMNVAGYLADGDPAKAQRVADLSLREVARVLARNTKPRKGDALSAEAETQAADVMVAWDEASPAARERFARLAHERGDMSLEERNRIILAAHHNPFLTEADREEAGKRFVSDFMASVPPEERQKWADLMIKSKVTGQQIAIALGDAIWKKTGGQRT